jgi:hypothetical protein
MSDADEQFITSPPETNTIPIVTAERTPVTAVTIVTAETAPGTPITAAHMNIDRIRRADGKAIILWYITRYILKGANRA